MKKIICAALILTAAYTISAQDPSVTYKATSEVDYSMQVPVSIKTNFEATYPTATLVTWMPVGQDWWYASYKTQNNRVVRVYYSTEPWHMMRNNGFKASFPILNTFVPDEVITNAINTYGNNLYSITRRNPNESGEMYHITFIKNGVSEIALVNAQGVAYTDTQMSTTQH